jgi:uncharacterized protein
MKRLAAGALALAFLWVGLRPDAARAEVNVPPLAARVMDFTGTLSSQQRGALEDKLEQLERAKGSQIAVLMLASTAPETIEQYGIRVGEKWKLGRKGVDDGAILIVAKDDRAMRIEVGYGLEGALNDAICKRIISETITPCFRRGDFYEGIDAGVSAMIAVVNGEPLPAPKRMPFSEGDWQHSLGFLFFGMFFAAPLLRAIFGRPLGATLLGGLAAAIAYVVSGLVVAAIIAGIAALLFGLVAGVRPSGWSSAGGWGGGFGSGGFRTGGGGGFGGGGGGFGGGGASGRW